MKKIDLKKELKSLYLPSAKAVAQVDVPAMNYLMIDGAGDPNTSKAYAEAIEALFAVAYTVKFMVKKAQEIDYGVMPLESLWWADDMSAFYVLGYYPTNTKNDGLYRRIEVKVAAPGARSRRLVRALGGHAEHGYFARFSARACGDVRVLSQ